MNFQKKYWSDGEFTHKNSGVKYIGYVGIYDNKPYIFDTEEELENQNTYLSAINTSDKFFDRTLAQTLSLPHTKNEVTFAANDFLYHGTVRQCIENLQDNNNYIYRNAILSNSILPYNNDCTLYLSNGDGILTPHSFKDDGLSGKTYTDPNFYPQKTLNKVVGAKNITGLYDSTLSANTLLIDNLYYEDGSGRDPDTQFYQFNLEEDDVKDVYNTINNTPKDDEGNWIDIDNISISEIKEELEDKEAQVNQKLNKVNKFYEEILGRFDITPISSNVTINLDYDDLNSLWNALKSTYIEDYDIEKVSKAFNIKATKVGFIFEKGEIPVLNGVDYRTTCVSITDYYQFVEYYFTEPLALSGPYEISDGKFRWVLNLSFASNPNCISYEDKPRYTIGVTTGTEESSAAYAKKIPYIVRKRNFRWKWTESVSSTPNESEIKVAPYSTFTYKYLKENPQWLNSKNNPHLIYIPDEEIGNDSKLMAYIPEDYMTAEDCYIYMTNNLLSYRSFPDIFKETTYSYVLLDDKKPLTYDNIKWIDNPYYQQKIYNIESYDIAYDEDEGFPYIVRGYKNAVDSYNELNEESEVNLEHIYGVNNKRNFDKIPTFKVEDVAEASNVPIHNFTELYGAELFIRDIVVDQNGKYAKLLVFLLFKTKVVIFELKHYIDNESLNISLGEPLELCNPEKYIEIRSVDPSNKNSLTFKNLRGIKRYGNMLYISDTDLNMVLRYDIEYLISREEPQAFDINSIKLLDVLQGEGNALDKTYFNNPTCIEATDKNVYIVDRGNQCVKVYSDSLNFIKTLKNGYYATHDVQCVVVNPYELTLENGTVIPKNSVWIYSTVGINMFVSIISDNEVIFYGEIEDIKLLENQYSWIEEIASVKFSFCNSNYIYLATNKRVYKFHASRPTAPFASLSYYGQRSLISTMVWGRTQYPWNKVPRIYSSFNKEEEIAIDNEVTWGYRPPTSAAEIMDNRCFTLCGIDDTLLSTLENVDESTLTNEQLVRQFEGDLIFHFGTLYDDTKVMQYIKEHMGSYEGEMTFDDIPIAELVTMVKSTNFLFYVEKDSYLSSLNTYNINIYDDNVGDKIYEDYINALTFNKMIYSVVFNLLSIKNAIIGQFTAATDLNNVIIYDNLIYNDYFIKLQMGNDANYFVHENEVVAIVVNRIFESILDIQQKIINKMQTQFMASQSFVNNGSRII